MENGNGNAKGSQKLVNGTNGLSTSMNGHAAKPRRQASAKQKRGFLSWSFSAIARLLTWYSIFTVLFRCPATLDECTEDSPRGCKSYFQLKHAVLPHVEPYYNSYAAPYVELARPYYQTVDQKVLTPGWTYATKYGGPRVTQAQQFGQAQWEKNLQPELIKYQALVKTKYDQNLSPYVEKASTAIAPYYDIAWTSALQTYHDVLLPGYIFVEPYAQQGYTTASAFTTETAIPTTLWAWNNSVVFLDSTVWPQLRYLYTENVEPQLVKIGQRIGRHNVSNTQKVAETISSTAAKIASTVTKPTSIASSASSILATPSASSTDTSSVESSSSDATEAASSEPTPAASESSEEHIIYNEVAAPEAVPGESDVRRIARETVTQDLKDWQEKYAQAADEGAVEIDNRIDEISKRMINRQANTMGATLVKELKKTIDAELETLKTDISSIIGQVKTDFERPENAEELITAAIRKAGLEIKDKSQDVRDWSENYEKELQVTVLKAAENHFAILENIRDLALQKIGMKWAWMEGVTYKDWKKYHLLKDRFNEWEADLKELITSHPGLHEAEDAGRAKEAEAMDLAQAAVKELASLKQVSGWKLAINDDSDEFDTDATRVAAEEAAKAKAAQIQEAEAAAESQDVSDQSATDSLTGSSQDPLASVAPGQAAEDAHDTPDLASSVILESTAIIVDAAEVTDLAEADQADEDDGVSPAHESDSSEPTASIKSALFGAAAQSVPSRQPVLDDDETSFEAVGSIIAAMQSDVPATISSAASSAYSAAMSGAGDRYSQALSLVSAQISGTPKPVHEQYLASVTSAYGEAVAKASSGLDAALSAATGVFATTTSDGLLSLPTGWANVESIAAAKLSENQAWAAAQYESAKIAIGLATATPTDISGSASSVASAAGESLAAVTAATGENAQKLLQNAQHNYYAGLGVAQERYSQFLAAASSALSSVTATPTPTDLSGTLSSAQSVAVESAGSVAAAGYENVASAASAAGSYASDSWNAVLDQVSAQVYGQPEPTAWYENLYSAAGDYAASATEAVGGNAESLYSAAGDYAASATEAVGGGAENLYSAAGDYAASATEAIVGSAQTVTSAAGSYASVASEEASKQYVAVSSIISELLIGKEPTLSESVYSRLAGAYAVAASSAESLASVASETVVSVATEATEAVKSTVPDFKDEL